jgi:hypothetical protein
LTFHDMLKKRKYRLLSSAFITRPHVYVHFSLAKD